ncbi:putative lipoprotein YehR precursor [compost metagenome]
MQYSLLGVETKEEAEKQIGPLTESYKGVEGITYNIEYKESECIETLTVDYKKVDIAELRKIPGMSFDTEDDVKKISMKRSEELLKGQGYTEKK